MIRALFRTKDADGGWHESRYPPRRKVLFYDTSSDTHFLIGSTVQTNETKEFEGETSP